MIKIVVISCGLVSVLSLAKSLPLEATIVDKSKLKDGPCFVKTQHTETVHSHIDNATIVKNIMCGERASSLVVELKSLLFEAERIKSKMLGLLANSTFLIEYINTSIPYDTPSMTCENLTDYMVTVYWLMLNVSRTLDDIETSLNCSQSTLDFIADDMEQLFLQTNQVACSILTNGLYRISDVSSLPIGSFASVNACMDSAVTDADVLGMIYSLVNLVVQTTQQEYDDVVRSCQTNACFSTTSGHFEPIIG